MQKIQERLKHLPRNEGYSLANSNAGMFNNAGSESVLMPQILTGLKNGEFTFYLQPRFDLNTQRVTGAEASGALEPRETGSDCSIGICTYTGTEWVYCQAGSVHME